MYEERMEQVVSPENAVRALETVERNRGAAGIDGMRTTQLRGHRHDHWKKIRSKLLAGTWTPSPVRRIEIPKPNRGCSEVGHPNGPGPVHSADGIARDDADL
jgi:retron-type reverse transcriptase